MNNYEKYLKYKSKYLDLKNSNQYGGQRYILQDEIYFWSRQMMEHFLILYLGLDDDNLKGGAFELHNKWKKFIDHNFTERGVKPDIDTVFLTQFDLAKLGEIDIDTVNRLIDATDKYKNKLIDILEQGKWVGWIFVSMVEHMLKETMYFKRKVNGPDFDVQEEIHFINDHHATELAATAQMIDPNPLQQKNIEITRSYAQKTMSLLKLSGSPIAIESSEPFPRQWSLRDEEILKGLEPSDQATLLKISLKYSQELTDYTKDTGMKIDSGELKSIIHPLLAHHIYREIARMTNTLQQLSTQ